MKYNKLFSSLVLVIMISGCVAPAKMPSNAVPSVPAAVDTLSNTPAPTPIPSTATATPYPSLRTKGPYLAYLRGQGDQNEIVFNGIVFMDADGKGQKLFSYPSNIIQPGSLPSLSNVLSPDGQWLAYYTGSAGKCFGNGGADTADLTLNLMSLSDGKTQVVTNLLSSDYPNNFAKAAHELNQPDISPEQLQNAFVCGITQSIDWSPDGHYLAFAGQMDGLSSDLYVYDTVSHTIRRLSSGPEEVQMVSWSPDSKWILSWSSYEVGEGMTYNLYSTSLDGSVIKKLPVSSCDTARWLDDQTCFSSEDGNGIGTHNLSLLNIETGDIVPVWDGEYSSLAISDDRQWIVFVSHFSRKYLQTGSDPNFKPGIYLVNLTTLKQTRVEASDNSDVYKAIQSIGDGDHLFALIDASENNLYYLSAEGKLAPAGLNADTFSVAPNKQYWVAFGDKIHVLKTDGTSIRSVDLPSLFRSDYISSIIWRPDSSGLFFIYRDPKSPNSSMQLYAMDLLTGDAIQVDMELFDWWPSDFVWVNNK